MRPAGKEGATAVTAVSTVVAIGAASNQLRGTIGQELSDAAPAFSPESQQLLRFHGIYQQDDRDVRAERARQRLDVDHLCMRVSIPGGTLTAEQYLIMDKLCDAVGNGTLRVTFRQGIQYHFVRKGDLHSLLGTLNDHLVTTLGACGDVVRNIMCCPAPLADRQRADVGAYAQEAARRFRPRTQAYYELWLDGERAVTAEAPGEEPLYGTTYLPRKFKIGFAFPRDTASTSTATTSASCPCSTASHYAVSRCWSAGAWAGTTPTQTPSPAWPTPSRRWLPRSCWRCWTPSCVCNATTATATTASTPG